MTCHFTPNSIPNSSFSQDEVRHISQSKNQKEEILHRNSKKSTVDVDLSSLCGGMNISHHHSRIFYDFAICHLALKVLGKNGYLVKSMLHLPEDCYSRLKIINLVVWDISFSSSYKAKTERKF